MIVRLLIFAVSISLPIFADARGIFQRDWIRVETQNFTIHSTLDEESTVELGRFLEMFRIATAAVTNVTSIESPVPTNIVALDKRYDYTTIGAPSGTAGIYLPGMRDNTIVLRDIRGDHEKTIIMHEYVHFLVRNNGRSWYPRWFNEGFAEYLSAADVVDGVFELGRVPEMRRYSLKHSNWIRINKIVDESHYRRFDDEQRAMFYAESWALVHFLLNRADRSFGSDMTAYLERLDAGVSPVDAFEQGFGVDIGPLNREVSRYLSKGVYNTLRLNVADILPHFEPAVSPLSDVDAALVIGRVALRRRELKLAEEAYTLAAASELTRARAEAGLGDVFKFRDQHADALPHFEEAVRLAPDDAYVQLDAGEFWHDMAQHADEFDERKAHIERARKHYLATWKLNDSLPELYAMLGESYTLLGDDNDRAVELLEVAQSILPSDVSIQIKLAKAYLDVGRNVKAVEHARLVLSWMHGDNDYTKQAREIIEESGE